MSGSTHRVDIPATPAVTDLLSARLLAAGALGVWERPDSLVAWFDEPATLLAPDDPADMRQALQRARWSIEADRDWQAEWKATISPVRAGRTVVVPSWLADEHRARPDDLTVVLDPGRAFGSGHHATTTLCLELLDELDLAERLHGRDLADVGCGSGILGIAAAARGAVVTGVDIDPDAVEVTKDNAARNRASVTARVGSVEAIGGPVEIVVANLVTDVIAQLAGDLVGATTDVLIASGITVVRQNVALDALASAGLRIDERRHRDGWLAVLGHRSSSAGA